MLLLPKGAKIIGQGITGREGSRTLPWALKYGTQIVAGVTPNKGGQVVESIPVFNTIKEALEKVGEVDGVVQFVPPTIVKSATIEAIDAGIKFILIGAEKVPVKDATIIYAMGGSAGYFYFASAAVPPSPGSLDEFFKKTAGRHPCGTPRILRGRALRHQSVTTPSPAD